MCHCVNGFRSSPWCYHRDICDIKGYLRAYQGTIVRWIQFVLSTPNRAVLVVSRTKPRYDNAAARRYVVMPIPFSYSGMRRMLNKMFRAEEMLAVWHSIRIRNEQQVLWTDLGAYSSPCLGQILYIDIT